MIKRNISSQRGSSVIEYLIGLMVLVMALNAPVFEGNSAVDMLITSIKQEHTAYAYGYGLPL